MYAVYTEHRLQRNQSSLILKQSLEQRNKNVAFLKSI